MIGISNIIFRSVDLEERFFYVGPFASQQYVPFDPSQMSSYDDKTHLPPPSPIKETFFDLPETSLPEEKEIDISRNK